MTARSNDDIFGTTSGWSIHPLSGERTAIIFSVRGRVPVGVAIRDEDIEALCEELRATLVRAKADKEPVR